MSNIEHKTIKRYVTFRDKLGWKIDEFKAAWNDDSYSENMGTILDPLIDVITLLAGYIPPSWRQRITVRNLFRVFHVILGITAVAWVFWQGFGRSAGAIPTTNWEENNIWSATGLYMLQVLLAWAFALTSHDIRVWLNLSDR